MASLEEIRAERIKKLELLKEQGINPYPVNSARTATLGEAVLGFSKLSKKKSVVLAGRVMAVRGQGALIFFDLNDGTGTFQGLVKKDEIAEEKHSLFVNTVDIGDFIEVEGSLFITKRKEKTIQVTDWNMLTKSLRPLPDKWHGLQDTEERFRKRYLDVISSPETKERFVMRSSIIAEIRNLLSEAGYMEVETPMLQPLYGGASAIPFTTHYNALEANFYLRISPELYLKRLLAAGFPKVFELNRSYRNEGIDVTHSPEFTMLEFYSAYENAEGQRNFVEKLIKSLVKNTLKKNPVVVDGETIDFTKKFAVITYDELLKKFAGLNISTKLGLRELEIEAKRLGVNVDKGDGTMKIIDNIYKKFCRPKLIQPIYIIDYPAEMLPLAKRKENDSQVVDAFQLIIAGMEMVKAFSELNDPIDQRSRFESQEKSKKLGDKEAQSLDEDFLEAMEHGIPPAAGVGIGIDRLAMLLLNQKNIREVILFPTLKPKV